MLLCTFKSNLVMPSNQIIIFQWTLRDKKAKLLSTGIRMYQNFYWAGPTASVNVTSPEIHGAIHWLNLESLQCTFLNSMHHAFTHTVSSALSVNSSLSCLSLPHGLVIHWLMAQYILLNPQFLSWLCSSWRAFKVKQN